MLILIHFIKFRRYFSCSLAELLLFEGDLPLPRGLFSSPEVVLDFVSRICEFVHSYLVEVLVVGFSTWVGGAAKSSVDTGCPAISGLVAVGDAGDGSHSDVLVDEVFRSEVVESLSEVSLLADSVGVLTLLECAQFPVDQATHDLKDCWHVGWLLLESGIFGEHSELGVDTSCPLRDLVVHDIDPLEPLLKLRLVIRYVA